VSFTSMAVVNGTPAIAYYDFATGDLRFIRATDASGTTWGTPVIIDSINNLGGNSASLAVVNGNPAIAYQDTTNNDLRYVRATDASGTTWGVPLTLESAGDTGFGTSLKVINGFPAVSYGSSTAAVVKYIRATDTSGTAWGAAVTVGSGYSDSTSMAVFTPPVGGSYPAISYFASADTDLKYVRATNTTGTLWGTPVTLDASGSTGQYPSMIAVGINPAISYYDSTNGDLKYMTGDFSTLPAIQINWIALPP